MTTEIYRIEIDLKSVREMRPSGVGNLLGVADVMDKIKKLLLIPASPKTYVISLQMPIAAQLCTTAVEPVQLALVQVPLLSISVRLVDLHLTIQTV